MTREWDDLVAATADWIDPWCSRDAWQTAVHSAFAPRTEPVRRVATGWALQVAPLELEDGTPAIVGLDRIWGFGAAVVGHPTDELCGALVELGDWRVAVLAGGRPGSAYEQALVEALVAGKWQVRAGMTTTRLVADLDEGWWSRRSGRFRQRLRQAERVAPVHFEICDRRVDMARMQVIEAHSHKGLAMSGLASPDMAHLYQLLIDAGAANRCVIATIGGADVGFILGGVHGGTYRGLQMSFVESARPYSIGNLLQMHEIRRHGGCRYDLGMEMDYKRHWADREESTRAIVLVRA